MRGPSHSIFVVEVVYELFLTKPYKEIVNAETTLVKLLVVGGIILAEELLSKNHGSLVAENLTLTVVKTGNVLVKAVACKSRVTDRYVVIYVAKILCSCLCSNILSIKTENFKKLKCGT